METNRKVTFFQLLVATSLLALSSGGMFLAGQEPPDAARKEYPLAKNAVVTPASSLIKVDGRLDEEAWKNAAMLEILYEWQPGENTPAPVRTEVLVTYDRAKLHVGFRCFDPEPRKIRAHLMDRDAIDTFIMDDHVSLMLDTFNDERRAFQFRINPLGVQADANFSELEGYEDFSWDAIWESAGRITDFGYVVEVAIPFNQLRFPKGGKELTWGFEADRSWPRTVRHRMSTHVRDRDRNCLLCQFNKISGFQHISPGKNLEFDPTLTVQRSDVREDFPGGRMEAGIVKFDPGITARWGVTPNLMLNATVNPDFSQVEADAAQLDVNTRFALYYPEKRPFFLEGADFFLTPLEMVFSRTVADPLWGGKATGKIGANAVGVFVTQDRINNLLFPSNQGTGMVSLDDDAWGGVFRFRRDIGRNSTLGVLYTGRAGDDYSNQVLGADGFLRLSRTKTFSWQALYSSTDYPEAVAARYGQAADPFSGYALYGSLRHDSRNLIYLVSYKDLGSDFRADFGFVPRVDTRSVTVNIHPVIWGRPGGWFDRLGFQVVGTRVTDHDGNQTDIEGRIGVGYDGPLQSVLQVFLLSNKILYQGVEIERTFQSGYLEMKPRKGLWYWLYWEAGDAVDYANARPASSVLLNPSLEIGLGRHLNLNLNHIYENLTLKGDRIYLANLLQARLIYNFSVRSFLRAIVQYSDVKYNPVLYSYPVEEREKGLFMQLLFSYKINPQTVLFLGYTDKGIGTANIDLTRASRTFFLKIGYALVR
ncbi:MAG: carbohydrate binding family 9 domain-containing protein [Candidatus Aminicenantes bacterium]|nr:carbohydrate binding family 9 domain-containing protein [Candidatus Aminicenantes bacterium]